MRFVTPLRYPGGKACLAPTLISIIQWNQLQRPIMAEPYAGGAGASLELLFGEHVRKIVLNDLDYRIFAFWWAVLNCTVQFVRRIKSVPISIPEWKRQRNVYRNPRKHKRFDVGFATFYLNRTNRSGILVNGGPIGGLSQKNEWKLDARFNRANLADRIERIAAYKERITLCNLDAAAFLRFFLKEFEETDVFLYLDPPYYEKGADLYLSTYKHSDHATIAETVTSCGARHWALTYDDVPAIRKMYAKCTIRRFRLRYTARSSRQARELLILSKQLQVPPFPAHRYQLRGR